MRLEIRTEEVEFWTARKMRKTRVDSLWFLFSSIWLSKNLEMVREEGWFCSREALSQADMYHIGSQLYECVICCKPGHMAICNSVLIVLLLLSVLREIVLERANLVLVKLMGQLLPGPCLHCSTLSGPCGEAKSSSRRISKGRQSAYSDQPPLPLGHSSITHLGGPIILRNGRLLLFGD